MTSSWKNSLELDNHHCLNQIYKNGIDFSFFSDDSFILNPAKSTFRTCENEIFSSWQFTPSILCESNDLTVTRHMVGCRKGIAYRKSSTLSKPVKDLIKLLLKAYDHT